MAFTYDALKDAELALMVSGGDSDAFAELAARYLSFIKWNASRFSGTDKDDLCQEGLLGLLSAAKSYDPAVASFKTYAKTCIVNRCISLARSEESASASVIPIDGIEFESGDSDPEAVFMRKEYYRLLRENVFHVLSRFERQVLFLHLNGYKYTQIAEKLSVSEKSADNALQRVRRKMKRIL